MRRRELSAEVEHLLAVWAPRLLPAWHYSYEVVLRSKLPEGACAASLTRSGEQSVHVFVGSDIPWGTAHWDLEITVVHELLHSLWVEADVSPAMEQWLDYTSPLVPEVVFKILKERWESAEEVLIDRVAIALIAAYSDETN